MRYAAISIAIAGGCGRVGFDAIPLAADASIDAAPVLLETMTIPATGEVQTSTTTLIGGVSYQLVASGSCTIEGVPPLLDAEWSFDAAMTAFSDLGDTGNDVGLGIDDAVFDPDVFPRWGTYRPDHIYTLDLVGADAPITVQIHDSALANNSGSLTLEIYR